MPGPDGRLLPEDIQRIRDELKRRRGGKMPERHNCPYCGQSDWVMGAHIVLDEMPHDPAAEQIPVVPYVVFFCQTCTYTMRFNAAMLGLFTQGASVSSPIYPSTATPGVQGG